MYVNIDNDVAIDMLIDRVHFWTDDPDVIELYAKYYENLVYCGGMDGCDFDVKAIVDNDYVNWTIVVDKEDINNYNEDYILCENGDLYLVSA